MLVPHHDCHCCYNQRHKWCHHAGNHVAQTPAPCVKKTIPRGDSFAVPFGTPTIVRSPGPLPRGPATFVTPTECTQSRRRCTWKEKAAAVSVADSVSSAPALGALVRRVFGRRRATVPSPRWHAGAQAGPPRGPMQRSRPRVRSPGCDPRGAFRPRRPAAACVPAAAGTRAAEARAADARLAAPRTA